MANDPIRLKGVDVLTPEMEERIRAEAERGYEPGTLKGVPFRLGRPRRGEEHGESPQVSARVPENVYRAATERAQREGTTISRIVRELLTEYATGERRAS